MTCRRGAAREPGGSQSLLACSSVGTSEGGEGLGGGWQRGVGVSWRISNKADLFFGVFCFVLFCTRFKARATSWMATLSARTGHCTPAPRPKNSPNGPESRRLLTKTSPSSPPPQAAQAMPGTENDMQYDKPAKIRSPPDRSRFLKNQTRCLMIDESQVRHI